MIAANYNWDDGFAVPCAIKENPHCDLGTALLLFYLAEGVWFLEDPGTVVSRREWDPEWSEFISSLHEKITGNQFASQRIAYSPPLTRVQLYQLRKGNPAISEVYLRKTPGDDMEIPWI